MDADLEGDGGAATVDARAYRADPQRLKEKQPFTWLGAAPYLALVLAGAALLAAGVVIEGTQRVAGSALVCTGTVLAIVGVVAACIAADEGWCECNMPRFGMDD